jgi:hypothetical protein
VINKTFEQCAKDAAGTIYADWEDGEFRCLVMRGPSSLCGYVGVKPGHVIFGKEYDDIPVDVHGGLTFSRLGDKDDNWPKGYYWIGWDYGHSGDKSFYYLEYPNLTDRLDHAWTPDEVVAEFPAVIEQLRKLRLVPHTVYTLEPES